MYATLTGALADLEEGLAYRMVNSPLTSSAHSTLKKGIERVFVVPVL